MNLNNTGRYWIENLKKARAINSDSHYQYSWRVPILNFSRFQNIHNAPLDVGIAALNH